MIPCAILSPQSKCITIGSAVFAQVTAECSYTLQWAPLSCNIAPSHGGYGRPSNTWSIGPTRVLNPNNISVGSAIIAGLTSVTDRLCYLVSNNRPHINRPHGVMQSNKWACRKVAYVDFSWAQCHYSSTKVKQVFKQCLLCTNYKTKYIGLLWHNYVMLPKLNPLKMNTTNTCVISDNKIMYREIQKHHFCKHWFV